MKRREKKRKTGHEEGLGMSSWVVQRQPDLMEVPTAPKLTPPLNEGPEFCTLHAS